VTAEPGEEPEAALAEGSAPAAGSPASLGPPQGSEPGGESGGDPAATGATGTTGVLTSDERRAGLDRELDASLKQFDDLISREQEDLSERREATAAQVAASSGGSSRMGSDDGGAPSGGQTTGGSPIGGEGGQAQASGANRGTSGGVPADVKDGVDDDVVARQLREAAESEKDPELREKLWQEYRDYKAGLSGKKKPKTTDPAPSSEERKDAGDEKRQEDSGDG
jgi:hypothetical protein